MSTEQHSRRRAGSIPEAVAPASQASLVSADAVPPEAAPTGPGRGPDAAPGAGTGPGRRGPGRRRRAMAAVVTAGALCLGALAATAPGAAADGRPDGHPGSRAGAAGTASTSGPLRKDFTAAAREFHVPAGLLMAVGYHESRWDTHGGLPSTTGAYSVMGLTHVADATLRRAPAVTETGQRGDAPAARDGGTAPAPNAAGTDPAAYRTLDSAAALTGASAATLRTDPRQSIRGGAALLARYQKQLTRTLPTDPGAWYGAVARFSQSANAEGAAQFADRVYATLKAGVSRVTDTGETVTLPAAPGVVPRTSAMKGLGLVSAAQEAAAAVLRTADGGPGAKGAGDTAADPATECPSGLACNFVPAAYKQNSPTDKSSYGNYDLADRPGDGSAIRYIVIHDTEGSYSGSLQEFQNSTALATPHYLVRSSDGQVTQLVPTKDVAWHAGNYYVNTHAIGIEHEGFAISGASWYDESLYESSAALVRYLAARFNVPLDRAHIIGHDDVPAPQVAQLAGMHWDPGPYWDWAHYMDLLGAPLGAGRGGTPVVGGEVTIDPPFTSVNEPAVTGCKPDPCKAQPANFVYLRTSPSATAPLLKDAVMAGQGAQSGSTQAADVTDKAVTGQTFAVAGVQGDWTAIWYGGQKAWFDNPGGRFADTGPGGTRHLVTPAGTQAVPVYGRAYPEASAYPAVIASVAKKSNQAVTPLGYTIPAGQVYAAADPVAADYFYAENIDQSAPGDQTRVVGDTLYYPIRFDHRLGYVKAADVTASAPR
ncbi:N-acetylmuramoyl-L-alanine amidase [Actinacidiphila yanglinensis]|uniref:N-acetylmuramoyl-L-alanine amidase n=1 Tax=Actinacidiphila yanglinensis TaxID=310779 RepID=A0A1H5ZK46_9ACTN|nr:N-acetylmuramoyl-L-alanine amidase [Actinacidiphila yanglinensis]SEG36027.1 N-acetylmuramoyl-L-alanine amidase [Actinacidiphila yanglinensis]